MGRSQCNKAIIYRQKRAMLQQLFAQNTCFLRDTAHENLDWALPDLSFALWNKKHGLNMRLWNKAAQSVGGEHLARGVEYSHKAPKL